MPNQQSDAEPFHTLCDAFEWYFTHLRIERRPQTPDERREFIRNFLGIKKREAQPVNRDIPDAIASLIACTPAPVTGAEVDAADSTFGDITEPIPNPALAAMGRWLCKHGGQPWFMVMTALFPHVSHSDRSSGQRAAVAWLNANSSPGMIRSLVEAMRAAGLEPPESLGRLPQLNELAALARIEACVERMAAAIESAGPRADGTMEGKPGAGSPPLQSPSAEAMTAWRLKHLRGINTQSEIASIMSTESNRAINQGQVSRWLSEATAYTEAGGIIPSLPTQTAQATIVDPAVIDMEPRTDRRSISQRDSTGD